MGRRTQEGAAVIGSVITLVGVMGTAGTSLTYGTAHRFDDRFPGAFETANYEKIGSLDVSEWGTAEWHVVSSGALAIGVAILISALLKLSGSSRNGTNPA